MSKQPNDKANISKEVNINDVSADEFKLLEEWVKASSNILEFRAAPSTCLVTGAPDETVKLCLISTLVPNDFVEVYMESMLKTHEHLIKNVMRSQLVRKEETTH